MNNLGNRLKAFRVRCSMSVHSKPKFRCLSSIINRCTRLSLSDVQKVVFEFVRYSMKWFLINHYNQVIFLVYIIFLFLSVEVKAGKSQCRWSSCREGCTVELFKCWQVRVIYAADVPYVNRSFVQDIADSSWVDLKRFDYLENQVCTKQKNNLRNCLLQSYKLHSFCTFSAVQEKDKN